MTFNRKIFDKIEELFKEERIELTQVDRGNGYYLYDFGDDSVVHFKVKGIKEFKFGCWILLDKEEKSYKISIFAQYERYIDKFKPSRSYLLAESMLFPVENNKKNPQYELEDLEVYDAISMIKFIKKHPVKAYYMDMHRLRYLYELDDCGSWIRKFIDDRKDDYRNYMEEYTYKHFQKMLRRLGRKGKIVAYYERDRLNEPPERINDDYYILCKDIKLNEKISKYVKKVKSKWYLQGTVFLSHNELNFYLDATDSYWEGELPAEDSQEYRDAIKDCMADLNEIKFSKGFIERMV